MKESNSIQAALLLCAMLFCLVPATAMSDYWGMVEAPDWHDSEGYTRQSWGFGAKPAWQKADLDGDGDDDAYVVDEPGYSADVHMDNAYGGAFFIRSDYGDAFAWGWMDRGPMMLKWNGLQGMIGGMGTGALEFKVHAPELSGRDRQIWIQYVAYIANDLDASAMETVVSTDPEFTARQGHMADRKWHRIARLDEQGAGGQWWRGAELWRISTPGTENYIRISTAQGKVNIIDSVDIITRASVDDREEDGKREEQ